MKNMQNLWYALGHFQNDVVASLWFTYLILFLKKVIHLPGGDAGRAMLIGQIADGCFTPVLSIFIDNVRLVNFYPKLKGWHALGTAILTISFAFVLQKPVFGIPGTLGYYIPSIVIFSIGWATVQLSHLALIPKLAADDVGRADLNSKRYGAYVIANVFTYLVSYIIFKQIEACKIDESAGSSFTYISMATSCIALVLVVLFHIMLHEPSDSMVQSRQEDEEKETVDPLLQGSVSDEFFAVTWLDWFSYPQLYLFVVIFLCARLANNTLQAYLALYISDTIKLSPYYSALLPFVLYVGGLIGALATKTIAQWKNTSLAYLIGAGFMLCGCTSVYFVVEDNKSGGTTAVWTFFVIFAIYGIGANMLVCSAYGLIAEFIGKNVQFSAFVYAVFGFLDKIINGVVIWLLDEFNPCSAEAASPTDDMAGTFGNGTITTAPSVGGCQPGKQCDFYGEFISKGTGTILAVGISAMIAKNVIFPSKAEQKRVVNEGAGGVTRL